ncbi:MAG: hypothetical protein M0Z92_10345 [Actinomycetota bacterium]|nr:hypothetical protein [Actinomycetota bacterium]
MHYVVTAGGERGGDRGATLAKRAAAREALRRWEGFPARAEPRPIVLVGPMAIPGGGFLDGDAKLAFEFGHVRAAEAVPEEVVALLRRPRVEGEPPHATRPLLLRSASLGEGEFETDRGMRRLPAWIVDAEGVRGDLVVLSRAGRDLCWWPPDASSSESAPGRFAHPSSVSADGMTLAYRFSGWPRNMAEYPDAEVMETPSAVAVIPTEQWIGPTTGWVTLAGAVREVEVHLTEALGGRVLVGADGGAVPVY